MHRKSIGFAIMLLSLINMKGFELLGIRSVGNLSLLWAEVWMMTAGVGFLLVVWRKKRNPDPNRRHNAGYSGNEASRKDGLPHS